MAGHARRPAMPGRKYGRKVAAFLRRRDAGLVPAQWVGTDDQRAATTTDPVAFVRQPGKYLYFHDRIRGQVFTHPVPTAADTNPDPLPHRYMKQVPMVGGGRRLPRWMKRAAK